MSPQEKQQLKALIVATGLYFGHEIPDSVLPLYVEDLADLNFADVTRAIGEARRDPRTTRFPLPAVIRAKLTPSVSDEDVAAEAAARITGAVRMYGNTNADRARKYIGELGWRVVQLDGGWQNVCETLTQDNLGTFRAQWRNLALTTARQAKLGTLKEVGPALPTRQDDPQLTQANGIVQNLARMIGAGI